MLADESIQNWLRDHPEAVSAFRSNARRLAETQFSRDVLAQQLDAVLRQAVRAALPGLLVGGHVLLEGPPGTSKSTP